MIKKLFNNFLIINFMKRVNRVLELIQKRGEVSKTQISKELEMPFSTVSKYLEELKSKNLISEKKVGNKKVFRFKNNYFFNS